MTKLKKIKILDGIFLKIDHENLVDIAIRKKISFSYWFIFD